MASTSTNKQPLLVDRVFHYVSNLDTSSNNGIDIAGTNTAAMIVNAVGTDGAIIEDIYSIARSTTAADINLYVSNTADYLRPNESMFVGTFKSSTSIGGTTHWENMPRVLTPVPPSGGDRYNQAFYLPKGKVLWAARNSTATLLSDGPLLGCQGGWY
jgi:hypothetical protein